MSGLDELAVAHLAHLEADQVPPNTVRTRKRTLRAIGTPGTISREDLEAWWFARADQVSAATRANDLSNLRAFYRWCQIWEHRADDPTIRLSQPKVGNGVPRPISRDDLHRVLEHLNEIGADDLRRAVCLGAYAGMRVSECAGLSWADVDLERRRALVWRSKGQKSRSVAIAPLLVDQLLPDTGGNVVTGTHESYSAAQLQRRANRAIAAAGVEATFHQLRHRYGTIAYQATGDLVALAKQMGHSSVVTTAIYADASDEAADKIAAAVVR